jgi:hypothetical protein
MNTKSLPIYPLIEKYYRLNILFLIAIASSQIHPTNKIKRIKSMNNPRQNQMHLNNNPEENIRMENEFLKLKLKAELGAETFIAGNFPPKVENEFLKNVLAFENSFSTTPMKKIYELLEKPQYKPEIELDETAIELALEALITLMKKKQITLEFLGAYSSRTKYKFITEEFFNEEVSENTIPGMIWDFNYDEYRPNHKVAIEQKTTSFISAWIDQKLTKDYFGLADTFIMPNGQLFDKDEIVNKIKNICKSFPEFKDCSYTIEKIDYELQNHIGMGFSEGIVKYSAMSRSQEKITIEGQFKLYFTLEFNSWSIFYFIFPGFEFPFME